LIRGITSRLVVWKERKHFGKWVSVIRWMSVEAPTELETLLLPDSSLYSTWLHTLLPDVGKHPLSETFVFFRNIKWWLESRTQVILWYNDQPFLMQWNLPRRNRKGPKFFCCKKFPFNTGTWIADPRDCKSFPLNSCLLYAQVLFKTDSTVRIRARGLKPPSWCTCDKILEKSSFCPEDGSSMGHWNAYVCLSHTESQPRVPLSKYLREWKIQISVAYGISTWNVQVFLFALTKRWLQRVLQLYQPYTLSGIQILAYGHKAVLMIKKYVAHVGGHAV
jgi:hypothetical protein